MKHRPQMDAAWEAQDDSPSRTERPQDLRPTREVTRGLRSSKFESGTGGCTSLISRWAAGTLWTVFVACAPYQPPERDAAVGTRFVGFDGDGRLALLETFTTSRADLVIERPEGGETERTAFRGMNAAGRARAHAIARGLSVPPWITPLTETKERVRWHTGGLQVEVRNLRPLGDRPRVAIAVRFVGTSTPAWSPVEIPVRRLHWPPRLVLAPDRAIGATGATGATALIRVRLDETDVLARIGLSQTRARLHHEVGRNAKKEGHLAAAEAALERATDEDPRLGDALYELAQVRALRGNPEGAAETLTRAFLRFPRAYRRKSEKDDAFDAMRARPDLAGRLGLGTPSR